MTESYKIEPQINADERRFTGLDTSIESFPGLSGVVDIIGKVMVEGD